MLYNYICGKEFCVNNFHAFSTHENIFTMKMKQITVPCVIMEYEISLSWCGLGGRKCYTTMDQ